MNRPYDEKQGQSEDISKTAGSRRLTAVFALLLLIAAALPAFLWYPFPTENGPQHAYLAFVLGRIADPALGLSDFFTSSLAYTGQGFVYLLNLLDAALPFAVAERLAVALTLCSLPLAGALAARLLGRPVLPVMAIAAICGYSWVLAAGYYNFLWALAVGLVVLAFGLRSRPGVIATAGLALSFAVLAWLHLGVAALVGLCHLLISAFFFRCGPTRVVRVVLAIAPAAGYGWWVATRSTIDGTAALTWISDVPAYAPWSQRVAKVFSQGIGGLSTVVGVVALVALTAVVVQGVRKPGTRRGLIFVGLAVLLASLIVPLRAAGWQFLAPRLVLTGCVVVGLASIDGLSRWRQLGLVVLTLLALGHATFRIHEIHAAQNPMVEAIRQISRPSGGALLNLDLTREPDPAWPSQVQPTRHLGLRALLPSGGVSPYSLAGAPSERAVGLSRPLDEAIGPIPDPSISARLDCSASDLNQVDQATGLQGGRCLAEHIGLGELIALHGLYWGEVVLFDSPEVVEARLRRRGFRLALGRAGVSYWVAQPQALALSFDVSSEPLLAPLVVRVGWEGVGWAHSRRFEQGFVFSAGHILVVGPVPAGRLVLEAFLDEDGDGRRGPTEPSFDYEPEVVRQRRTEPIRVGTLR